jgi:hypothetical protein
VTAFSTGDFAPIAAQAVAICRCGSYVEIGRLTVKYGALVVTVRMTAGKVRWPHEIDIPPACRTELDLHVRLAWLRLLEEQWRTRASK